VTGAPTDDTRRAIGHRPQMTNYEASTVCVVELLVAATILAGCDRDAKKEPPAQTTPVATAAVAPAVATASATAPATPPKPPAAPPQPAGDHSKHPHPGGQGH